MQDWKWNHQDGLDYIDIPQWKDLGAVAVFTSRRGGVSTGCFESLNMGLHVGDEPSAVLVNRQRYASILGQESSSMVCCEQVHGHQVIRVNKSHAGSGARDLKSVLQGYDAMVTNQPGILLTAYFADCIPLYFFDPEHRVIGLAHSGWKGTMGRIAVKTLQTMRDHYGSRSENIQVFIGPGIGPCCFQIQPDLMEKVNAEFTGFDGIIMMNKDGYFWDLPATNHQMLLEWGVQAENIIHCSLCTSCRTDVFYSYRRERGNTGRMAAGLALCTPR